MARPETRLDTLLRSAAERLASISDAPGIEAEYLAKHVFGLDRAHLVMSADTIPHAHASARFTRLVEARLAGQPLAYVIGRQPFFDFDVAVSPAVLVPRFDTEILVGRALDRLHAECPTGAVLELGTGSGVVALALATVLQDLHIVATDRSPAALEVARSNWRELAAARSLQRSTIRFIQGDWYGALSQRHDLPARYDMIVSNPPYVGTEERGLMSADTAAEPAEALFAGSDGLDAIRIIVRGAPARLQTGGRLLLEHGFRQGDRVSTLMRDAGFESIHVWPDLSGHPRVCEGRLPD